MGSLHAFMWLGLSAFTYGPVVVTALSTRMLSSQNESSSKCLPAGEIVFHHVAATGETSADEYFDCICKELGCSMKVSVEDLHDQYHAKYPDGLGQKECQSKPHICAVDGNVKEWGETCGSAFAHPKKSFIILRDPVYRVFAHYFEFTSKDFFKQMSVDYDVPPLPELAKICTSGEPGDVNEKVLELCPSLSNYVSSQVLTRKSNRKTTGRGVTDRETLKQAMNNLKKYTAVFILERFSTFKRGVQAAKIVPDDSDAEAVAESCNLPHETFDWSGAAPHHDDGNAITDEDIKAIKEMNLMDLEVYKYAKSLPNVFTERSIANVFEKHKHLLDGENWKPHAK